MLPEPLSMTVFGSLPKRGPRVHGIETFTVLTTCACDNDILSIILRNNK